MPDNKLVFVNGNPKNCTCSLDHDSGGGQYSEVHSITLCATHAPRPFGPVEVVRDTGGWWWHPDIPNFGDGEDPAPYTAWVAEQRLQVKGWHSGDEIYDLPDEDAACTAWNPESPAPEWFLLGIFDTDDGPYVQWARRVVRP
ncbi:hypothetical protein ABQX22_13485 [Xanthomonas sp. WHRI 1810A]|uniref:hypothetical protein n=1 Tax=Xanthomonas sp. WHRI 1810A TaxID=3161565 RepID=UPI0032E8B8D5